MKSLLSFFCFLVLVSTMVAQQHSCGLDAATGASIATRLQDNRNWIAEHADLHVKNGTTIYVPITFHIISDDAGAGGASEVNILRTLCKINAAYEEVGIQFYLKRFNYFSNDEAFYNPRTIQGIQALNDERVDDSINLFISVNANADGQTEGTVLGYYYAGPGNNFDWVVIRRASMMPTEFETTAHELGHFLSLNHTFYGWECGGHCEATNAPNMDSCDDGPTEKMDGSNCNFAGDGICDTPPDYAFSSCLASSSCPSSFQPIALDPNGVAMLPVPAPHNFMNYVFNCAEYVFTPMQIEAMNDDINSNQRNYCTPNYTPSLTIIADTAALISPLQDADLAYNQITFEWEPVPNATNYIIEFDISNSFNIAPRRFFTTSTSITLSNVFQPNETLRWRVYPYHEYGFCAPFSATRKFTTNNTVKTEDPNKIVNWYVAPNPAMPNQVQHLVVDLPRSISGQMRLTNLSGQVLYTEVIDLTAGRNSLPIPNHLLAAGTYFVSVITQLGDIRLPILIHE
jgi:Metallo-peptidase family M12B Reprolysin-like